MNRKDEYIRLMLNENIDTATKTIEELYAEVEELRKLPNDCTGIDIEGMVCENPNYKIDLLTGHMHVIGYFESQRTLSKELLELNDMDDDQFEDYLIEQEDIRIHNEKELEKLNSLFSSSDKDTLSTKGFLIFK